MRVKGNYTEKIHELLYKDGKKTLLLESLVTNTYVFPYAVINNSNVKIKHKNKNILRRGT